jgi:D-alanyl-D-alanine carboxypeptidase
VGPLKFRLPPYSRLGIAALVAVIAFGALVSTSRLAIAPSIANAATRPASTAPAPWYEMNVGTASIHFWAPSPMPAGAPAIRGRSGILIDLDTGEILWQKLPNLELAPASLTKVLTSLVALENFDPSQEVTVTSDALGQ